MKPRATRLVPLALSLSLAALPARPQERALELTYNINPSDFHEAKLSYIAPPPCSTDVYLFRDSFFRPNYSAFASCFSFVAPLHLPAGAKMNSITVFYDDTHPSEDPVVELVRTQTNNVDHVLHRMSFPVFAGGNHSVTELLTSLDPRDFTIDNESFHYSVLVTLYENHPAADDYIQLLRRIRIRYQLQVSPAPSSATFDDVAEDHPYFRFVEALLASGITAGCQKFPPMFCPERPVTRGEMAVFLAKALGLHWPVAP